MSTAPPSPPVPPASPSEDALYALIARLQAQIAELEARLNATSPSAPPPRPASSPPPPRPPPPLSPPDGDGIVWWHIALPVVLGTLLLLVLIALVWCLCRRRRRRQAGLKLSSAPSLMTSLLRHLPGTSSRSRANAVEAPGFGEEHSQSATLHAEMIMDTSGMVSDHLNLEFIVKGAGSEESGRAVLLQKLFASTKPGAGNQRQAEAEARMDLAERGSESRLFDAESLARSIGSLDAALVFLIAMGGSEAEVSSLLQRGASPRASLLGRGPALAMAARRSSHAVARLLLHANAGVDEKDSRGWTPLMHAIDAHSNANPREETITLLLEHGAAVDVWSEDLRGPLDLITSKDITTGPAHGQDSIAEAVQGKHNNTEAVQGKQKTAGNGKGKPTTPGRTKGKDSVFGHTKQAPPPGNDSRRV